MHILLFRIQNRINYIYVTIMKYVLKMSFFILTGAKWESRSVRMPAKLILLREESHKCWFNFSYTLHHRQCTLLCSSVLLHWLHLLRTTWTHFPAVSAIFADPANQKSISLKCFHILFELEHRVRNLLWT